MTNNKDIIMSEDDLNEYDSELLAARVDGISKGLKMGMAEIYGQLLSFDKQNIEDDKPSFAFTFLKQQADDLGQSFDEFMDEQNIALGEYYEYRDAINKLYDVSDKYGYKE
jgi:hypothetical protein